MCKFMSTIAGKDAPFKVNQYLWVVCIWNAILLTTSYVQLQTNYFWKNSNLPRVSYCYVKPRINLFMIFSFYFD